MKKINCKEINNIAHWELQFFLINVSVYWSVQFVGSQTTAKFSRMLQHNSLVSFTLLSQRKFGNINVIRRSSLAQQKKLRQDLAREKGGRNENSPHPPSIPEGNNPGSRSKIAN